MSNIEKLFDIVYRYTRKFKTKYPEGDGLAFWKSIKGILAKYDDQTADWSGLITKGKLHKEFYPVVMKLPEYYILGDGTKIIDEPNHFLIQVFRIPTQDELTPRKLAQIALNLGQLYPELKPSQFSKELINKILEAGLVNPKNFATVANLKKLKIDTDTLKEVEEILASQI